MRHRLKEDFRLSIITLIGIFAAPAIALIGVMRYMQGSNLGAALDAGLVFFIITIVVLAWRTKNSRLCGLIAAVGVSAGAVSAAMINGLDGLLWLYPCLMVSFFLARPVEAFLINTASVFILLVFYDIDSIVGAVPFVLTALMLSICSYVYAYRAELHQQRLSSLNFIDPLTGTKNRRAMDVDLNAAIANLDRTGTGYALAMMDIDHFKSVNDQYGHDVGDSILIALVELVEAIIRPYDQIYRFGGEEFFILFSDVDTISQKAVIHKLQQAIRAQLKTPDGRPVTASFGVVCLKPGMSQAQWQQQADQAMYDAKAAGRDAVVYCSNETVLGPEALSWSI